MSFAGLRGTPRMKLKQVFRSRYAKVCTVLTVLCFSLVTSAFATETNATMDTIAAATVTQLTSVQQALLNLIQQILPVALVVVGSILVVTLGIRLFRRFAG